MMLIIVQMIIFPVYLWLILKRFLSGTTCEGQNWYLHKRQFLFPSTSIYSTTTQCVAEGTNVPIFPSFTNKTSKSWRTHRIRNKFVSLRSHHSFEVAITYIRLAGNKKSTYGHAYMWRHSLTVLKCFEILLRKQNYYLLATCHEYNLVFFLKFLHMKLLLFKPLCFKSFEVW